MPHCVRQLGVSALWLPKVLIRSLLHLARTTVTALLLVSSAYAAETIYTYDELGRLTGVVDGSGNAAIYEYDASGNLISIERKNANEVSIIDFAPKVGSVGTSVRVVGTGYSATPNQNNVQFNGVAATVVAASASELTVTVPTSATTGTINVTSPLGSATSDDVFTVVASAVPVITSFTPTIGSVGTSVTLSGNHFATSIAGNRVAFANVDATLSSATTTQIGAAVPLGASSGPISVTTSQGTGYSATDFFVPPPSYSASDVAFTGRINFGSSATATINAANKIAMLLFDGIYGQRISLAISGASFGCSVSYKILNPDGSTLAAINSSSATAFIDVKTLLATGSYTVLVDPSCSSTGSATLTLYSVPPDITGPIVPGGSLVTVTTTVPGQNVALTFSGTTGQRVALQIASSSFNGISVDCKIVNPDGTTLGFVSCANGGGGFIDTKVLPSTGTYTVSVNPSGIITGSTTLTLYSVPPDITGPIVPGGSPVTVTTTVPGQNVALTFSGTAGQRVALQVTGASFNGVSVDCRMLKPDGTTLGFVSCASGGGGFIDTKVLPSTGTYTVSVSPNGIITGSATLTLYNVPADVSGTIVPGGSSVTVATTAPGQNVALTFSATAGQHVSLRVTGADFNVSNVTCRILKPDGTTLEDVNCSQPSGAFIDTQTLPSTGTYTVAVDPSGAGIGSATLALYDVPADGSTPITLGGSSVTIAIAVPGQSAQLVFAGSASQQATVRLTSNGIGQVAVTLRKPDGSTLTSKSSSLSGFNLTTQTLPVSGDYTIYVNPSSANTGNITVAVTNP